MKDAYQLGIIGCGNMGGAILSRVLSSKTLCACDVLVSEPSEDARARVVSQYGVDVTGDNAKAARCCKTLILAVKPRLYETVLSQIAGELAHDATVVAIAPGFTLERLESLLNKPVAVIRAMPNTPAMVGEGMTGLCANARATQAQIDEAMRYFACLGRAEMVSEYMMDAVVGVSGSASAYAFMMIDAMADGAVRGGMPRAQAIRFAAQALLGGAKMVLETGKHPSELKDMVCTPAGTTIEAVAKLEECGFRNSILQAMDACIKKAGGR